MSTQHVTRSTFGLGLALAVLVLGGCRDDDGAGPGEGSDCIGAKCDAAMDGTDGGSEGDESGGDTDDGAAGDEFPAELLKTCEQRKDEAYTKGRPAFARDHLRWSCADVVGTAAEDRGQEYCEYFAMVQRPGAGEPDLLGLLNETAPSTEETDQELEVTEPGIELTAEEIEALEADPTAVAGRCVFTSWNADVEACSGQCNYDDEVFGIPVIDDSVFRMTFDANTYDAAEALVADCMDYIPGQGADDNPDDPFHDDFLRACELNSVINETEYRKSDNTVCAAALRLAECGCYMTLRVDLPTGLSQKGKLGFPLGSWEAADSLPAGCRYESVVPGAQQLVTCELTAAEVIDNASELKSYCAQTYGDDVVVHVPVPAAAIRCDPDVDNEPYASTCADEPWNVSP
ncbi:MAG: hypothetical protein AAF721_06835 [Myxococcota bacterium]